MHRARVGPCTRADVSAGVRAQSIRKVRPVPFGARRYPGIIRPNPYHRTVRFPVPSVGTRQVSGTIISQLWEANPNLVGTKFIFIFISFLGVGPNVTRLEVQGPEPQVLNQALGRTLPWAPPRVATVIRVCRS